MRLLFLQILVKKFLKMLKLGRVWEKLLVWPNRWLYVFWFAKWGTCSNFWFKSFLKRRSMTYCLKSFSVRQIDNLLRIFAKWRTCWNCWLKSVSKRREVTFQSKNCSFGQIDEYVLFFEKRRTFCNSWLKSSSKNAETWQVVWKLARLGKSIIFNGFLRNGPLFVTVAWERSSHSLTVLFWIAYGGSQNSEKNRFVSVKTGSMDNFNTKWALCSRPIPLQKCWVFY